MIKSMLAKPAAALGLHKHLLQFRRLSRREQLLIILGAVVVSVAVLYSAVWAPSYHYLIRERNEYTRQRTLAAQLEAYQSIRPNIEAMTPKGTEQALTQIINEAAAAQGVTVNRMETGDNNSVSVWINEAGFDDFIDLTFALEQEYGLTLDTVSLERTSESSVSAQLRCSRP